MKQLIQNISNSFKHGKDGFQSRKLAAFTLMACICYCHYKYVDLSNVVSVIGIDLLAVGVLLGLVTMENIITLKNGSKEIKQDSESASHVN